MHERKCRPFETVRLIEFSHLQTLLKLIACEHVWRRHQHMQLLEDFRVSLFTGSINIGQRLLR